MELTWRNFWFESKAVFKDWIGLSEDMIHVHFGIAMFLICALILRKYRAGPLIAWSIVAACQIVNEFMDARDWINWTGSVNWNEVIKDSVWTLFWPTVFVLVWRWIGWKPEPQSSS